MERHSYIERYASTEAWADACRASLDASRERRVLCPTRTWNYTRWAGIILFWVVLVYGIALYA